MFFIFSFELKAYIPQGCLTFNGDDLADLEQLQKQKACNGIHQLFADSSTVKSVNLLLFKLIK